MCDNVLREILQSSAWYAHSMPMSLAYQPEMLPLLRWHLQALSTSRPELSRA
jgi:hypothetical protein